MKNISLEYIAGLFDGEGWITVNFHSTKKTLIPIVGIKMNGLNLLKYLNKKFGGYCYSRKGVNRPLTEWSLRGAYQVLPFLKSIVPFLHIKKEQADLCIELCKTYSIRQSNGKWIKKIKLNSNIINLRKNYSKKIKLAKGTIH